MTGILSMSGEVPDVAVRIGEAVEVLLLLDSRHGGGGLLLGMLMVGGLLVHPGRVPLGVELVVSVDVRRGHHHGRALRRAASWWTR